MVWTCPSQRRRWNRKETLLNGQKFNPKGGAKPCRSACIMTRVRRSCVASRNQTIQATTFLPDPSLTNMTGQSSLERWLTWSVSPSISAILVTLVISLLLPVLIHTYLYKKAVAREAPSFLLVGPSGAGKTSLLTLVCHPSSSSSSASSILT